MTLQDMIKVVRLFKLSTYEDLAVQSYLFVDYNTLSLSC